jgi:hypothetical protein
MSAAKNQFANRVGQVFDLTFSGARASAKSGPNRILQLTAKLGQVEGLTYGQ